VQTHTLQTNLRPNLHLLPAPALPAGSLLAFECLSDKLGRLFEPYVIQILPMLLICFGDSSQAVRDAADGAARAIMGQLTGQGVKLVLPALLRGVEDKVWRTKQGSIQLLGAMAHCAPKQLGSCLPVVVPRLGQVLADPHPKVAAAAKTALTEVRPQAGAGVVGTGGKGRQTMQTGIYRQSCPESAPTFVLTELCSLARP
jgi:hypothetical protein